MPFTPRIVRATRMRNQQVHALTDPQRVALGLRPRAARSWRFWRDYWLQPTLWWARRKER